MVRWYFLWFNEIDKIFSILDSVFWTLLLKEANIFAKCFAR